MSGLWRRGGLLRGVAGREAGTKPQGYVQGWTVCCATQEQARSWVYGVPEVVPRGALAQILNQIPAAARSASALSVFSHGKAVKVSSPTVISNGLRPKCP